MAIPLVNDGCTGPDHCVHQRKSEFISRGIQKRYLKYRPQNNPYFWVFKYARAVKQKVWSEAENRERDRKETLKILLSPHMP